MSSAVHPPTESCPVEAILSDAAAALSRGNVAEARTLCGRAQARLASASAPVRAAGALARIEARASLAEGDSEAAFDALGAALAIAEASRDHAGTAHTLNHFAIAHFARSELDQAERYYEAARERARRAGERTLVAATTMNLGAIANIRGDARRAIAACRRAIKDLRLVGSPRDLAAALNTLGMAKSDLGQWAGAERAYQETLEIAIQVGDSNAQLCAHCNLAETWIGRGDLSRARAACSAAMTVAVAGQHAAAVGDIHKLSGIVAREAGALEEAEAEFVSAEAAARARDDLLLLAETAREQADLFRRQSRNRETLQALNRSHRIFQQLKARRDLADVDRRVGRLEDDFVVVAKRWGESIEAADRYTQGHCQRVADLACLVATHAGVEHGFDAQGMFWFRIGALLHDVGKLGIPGEVLNKPGKLTDEEFALMRSHTTVGVDMLADIEFPWDIRPIVLSHHERWDGRGYPHRLAGEAIPLTARILCVADVYDALTSVRSYKRALTHDEAMDLLRKDAGTAFDPRVFAWFEAVAPAWAEQRGAPAAGAPAPVAETDARAGRVALGLDPLTGLPPRDGFYRECERVLAARRADERPTGLVLVRIADAAAVAAERGRTALDAGVAAVADALSRNTRGGDFVGRYSDEEFVVLLPDEDLPHTHAASARLQECAEAVRVLAPSRPGATPAPLALRIVVGVAAAPQHGATADGLLAAADATMGRGGAARRAA